MKLLELYQMKQSELRTLRNAEFTQSYVGEFRKNEFFVSIIHLIFTP